MKFILASALVSTCLADVNLVTFDGAQDSTFKFEELNDPVMGGQSSGNWSVSSEGFGVFQGQVLDVPSLKAPGFIKAAADGKFADASSEAAGDLVLLVRSSTPDYAGFRVAVASGTLAPAYSCAGGGSIPLSRGCFKAKFSVPAGADFTAVHVPFEAFSDLWSPATGELTKTCADQADACLSASKLEKIKRVELWAEGADGQVNLEVKAIYAASSSAAAAATSASQSGQGSYACPGSSAWVYAWSEQTATIQQSCQELSAEVQARVAGQYFDWHDPHNNGTYSVLSASDSTLQLTRRTGNNKYTDKLTLSLSSSANGGCTLQGCSESQVTSIYDAGTNYCNLRVLYCGSADGCKAAKTDLVSSDIHDTQSVGAGSGLSNCLLK